jgi:2-polyprenyl-6-hydroxyphenyl methylase/3-demethylubiquinone-9 3-methyltransferase
MSTLNRTTKSYLMSIIGAEYILRWLPIGTHDWKLFVKPSELHRLLRSRELDVLETTGMTFNPATWKWSLNPKDLSVNYLLVAEKL